MAILTSLPLTKAKLPVADGFGGGLRTVFLNS
jgi:hypothetical protein